MAEQLKQGKVHDLIQDDRNLNKGTERGQQLIEKSLRQFGAGRSILVDKNNRIIAGNKTHANAEAAGIDDAVIVETDGTKLVVVKRTDIDLDTKQGREMALADNATVKVDLEWDTEQLESIEEDFGINGDVWGVDIPADIEDEEAAVGEGLVAQLEAQEFTEKENYFIKKPFVVIFYDDKDKNDLEKVLGITLNNDTYTYEQLHARNIDSLPE